MALDMQAIGRKLLAAVEQLRKLHPASFIFSTPLPSMRPMGIQSKVSICVRATLADIGLGKLPAELTSGSTYLTSSVILPETRHRSTRMHKCLKAAKDLH